MNNQSFITGYLHSSEEDRCIFGSMREADNSDGHADFTETRNTVVYRLHVVRINCLDIY